MPNYKAVGLDNLPMDVLKGLREKGIKLTHSCSIRFWNLRACQMNAAVPIFLFWEITAAYKTTQFIERLNSWRIPRSFGREQLRED